MGVTGAAMPISKPLTENPMEFAMTISRIERVNQAIVESLVESELITYLKGTNKTKKRIKSTPLMPLYLL